MLCHGEMIAHYQPILNLKTGRISGFEALARWDHPVRGLLAPGVFIHIAESNGLILPIGEEILRAACVQIGEWNERVPGAKKLTVSVNLSNRQIELGDRAFQPIGELGVGDPRE